MTRNPGIKEDRGQHAERPAEIPWKGWKEIIVRVTKQISEDHVQVVAAGIAFYFFLAMFPAIAAVASIYGLVAEPGMVQQQMTHLTEVLPDPSEPLVADIMENISEESTSTLGLSLAIGILISLFSAKKAISAIFDGVNIAYGQVDRRGFLKRNGLQLLFTLGAVLGGILAVVLVAAWPAIIDALPLPELILQVASWGRWLLLGSIVFFGLVMVYKFGPDRDDPKTRWVRFGALLATALWLSGSGLFSLYVDTFASYDKTYGSFAAIIILMFWFFLTAFVILLGAEINSEMERQTTRDTTVNGD